MSFSHSVAYVESPLQLINVFEAHARGLLGTHCAVVVRDPNKTSAPTLAALKDLPHNHGLQFFNSEARAGAAKHTPPKGKFISVLGDPFSGQQQSILLRRTRLNEVVIIDDGLNTYAAIEALASNKPMVRPGQTLSPARKALGFATTRMLRNVAFAGQLTIFTAMPATERMLAHLEVLDARVVFHKFDWLASQSDAEPNSPQFTEDRIIVGSGFAADGLIDEDAYVGWVADLAQDASVRYLPHRRTTGEVLERINAIESVSVTTSNASVEVALRSVQAGTEIHLLPTTALITLSTILRNRGVSIVPHAVPQGWWNEDTPDSLREFLARPLELFESTLR